MLRISLCLMFILSLVGAAHAQDSENIMRTPYPIETVEVITADDGSFSLVVSGSMLDGCKGETIIRQERFGAVLFVDLHRELPADTMCPEIIMPYTLNIDATPLFTLDDDASLVSLIIVNGAIFGIERAMIEPVEGAITPPPLLNPNYVRVPLAYEHIETNHTPDGTMAITLAGTLNDMCITPVYRPTVDPADSEHVIVEAYGAINIAAMCMAGEMPFETTFATPTFMSLSVNDVSIPYNPAISAATQRFDVLPVTISEVVTEWIEGLQPNLKIDISGTYDGCEYPIQMSWEPPKENTYQIRVLRVQPESIPCSEAANRPFSETAYLTPDMSIPGPIMLYIGNETFTVDR